MGRNSKFLPGLPGILASNRYTRKEELEWEREVVKEKMMIIETSLKTIKSQSEKYTLDLIMIGHSTRLQVIKEELENLEKEGN